MSVVGYAAIAGVGGAFLGVAFTAIWARARLAAVISSLDAEKKARSAAEEVKRAQEESLTQNTEEAARLTTEVARLTERLEAERKAAVDLGCFSGRLRA